MAFRLRFFSEHHLLNIISIPLPVSEGMLLPKAIDSQIFRIRFGVKDTRCGGLENIKKVIKYRGSLGVFLNPEKGRL